MEDPSSSFRRRRVLAVLKTALCSGRLSCPSEASPARTPACPRSRWNVVREGISRALPDARALPEIHVTSTA
ncbi:MAG: hypothetical protein AAB075_11095, partial [Gemmatimonadota bacterium]